MIRIQKDYNVLTDAEIDLLLTYLNAAYERTGETSIMKCIGVLMEDNNALIISENQPEHYMIEPIESIVPVIDIVPDNSFIKEINQIIKSF